ERGENYDVFIPIFAYPNCDQYYDTGEYALSCRICRYNKAECKWEDYSDFREETQIEISGQNECPIKTITKTYGTGNSATPTYGSYDIENVNLQKIAKRNEKINISFTLKNTESKTKICKVKSYIYSSQKIANTGGWIPNEKEIHLGAYGSKKIILENTIKEDIEEGFYNYRIRVTDWTTGKKTDSTSGIEIKGILEWNGTSSDNAKEQKSSNTGAELSCSNADEKIKVVIKNKHKEEINFTLHSFGLTEKEKTYSIKRQKTLYFNSINSDSEVFFIAEYNFDNVKKYTACSVLTNKTIKTSIFNADENSFTNNLSIKQNENTITGRTIHVKKKGLIDSLVGWLKNIL
ncbi:MAG: hypothetical protein KAQ92_01510, partial [Candidatus Aenigmarchaeota archaeon]|nr:hypothetical protein [Candidatus Aenigmarchaeota archaeon]